MRSQGTTTQSAPRSFLTSREAPPVNDLLCDVPRPRSTYCQRFLGCGELVFALRPERAFLTSRNSKIVGAYRVGVVQTSS